MHFYLHISKEPIELFRIAILTFENEARSEELWRFMCGDTRGARTAIPPAVRNNRVYLSSQTQPLAGFIT